jgi:HAD superfamily hydrolase (TIGR01509 family)
MKKLILFDLDGVLVDTVDAHFKSLNKALLAEGYFITAARRHLYEGKTSVEKMKMLDIPDYLIPRIQTQKDVHYLEMINNIKETSYITQKILELSKEYRLAVCTNSNRSAAHTAIDRAGLKDFFELILSAEDVTHRKPNPEIYNLAMERLNSTADNTYIIEDSAQGMDAAEASGAHAIFCPMSELGNLQI